MGEAYYDEVHLEIENGGIAALYHHLLHLDLGGFHPRKRPPMTKAKEDLIHLSATSEVRFIGEWIAGDTDLPICPCLSMDLYAAYLKWCRTHGENHPRPDNQFHGTIKHMPGWDKRPLPIYRSLNGAETHNKPIITPPDSVLVKSGTARPEGKSAVVWRTEGVFKFSNAVHGAGNGE